MQLCRGEKRISPPLFEYGSKRFIRTVGSRPAVLIRGGRSCRAFHAPTSLA